MVHFKVLSSLPRETRTPLRVEHMDIFMTTDTTNKHTH